MNIIKLKIISGPMNEEEFLLHTNRSILLGREDLFQESMQLFLLLIVKFILMI